MYRKTQLGEGRTIDGLRAGIYVLIDEDGGDLEVENKKFSRWNPPNKSAGCPRPVASPPLQATGRPFLSARDSPSSSASAREHNLGPVRASQERINRLKG